MIGLTVSAGLTSFGTGRRAGGPPRILVGVSAIVF